MLHPKALSIELDSGWDVFGRENDVIDGLDREASHDLLCRTFNAFGQVQLVSEVVAISNEVIQPDA